MNVHENKMVVKLRLLQYLHNFTNWNKEQEQKCN